MAVLAAWLLLAAPAGAAPAAAAAAPADSLARRLDLPWTRPDRLQHAGLSFVVAAGTTLASEDARAGFAVSLSFGLLKEWLDARRGRAEALDVAADAAGAALGSLAARGLRR